MAEISRSIGVATMIFDVEQRIEAPVETVWRYLSEPRLMGAWMAGIDGMRSQDGAPLDLHSRILFSARGAERSSEVVAFEPQRRITLSSTQGRFTATYEYSLRPDGAATVARLRADCVARGPARLVAPLIRVMVRRADQGQLEGLAAAIG